MPQESQLLKYAAAMRRAPTPFEAILWKRVRNSSLDGHKFRRQHVIGCFIVDFFCPAKSLAVEIDGETHDPAEMAARDAELAKRGIRTIHYSNRDIRDNLEGVLETLAAELQATSDRWPHPNPSPEGDGLDT